LVKIVEDANSNCDSLEFTALVAWTTKELKDLLQLEECVNKTASSVDFSSFCMEVSAFLKELGCPHPQLMEGSATDRLSTYESRLLLLHFILVELMGARMTLSRNPQTGGDIKMVG